MNPPLSDTDTEQYDFRFLVEEYDGENKFIYIGPQYELDEARQNLFCHAATNSTSKWKYPAIDPPANEYVDTRTPKQVMEDINRIMLLCLTEEELELWSEIAERDLSHRITLTGGIRTPKQIVTDEIKQWRKKKQKVLLDQLPPPTPMSQTTAIPVQPPAEEISDIDTMNPADLPFVPDPVGQQVQECHANSTTIKSAKTADHKPGESGNYDERWSRAKTELAKLHARHNLPLSKLLRKNRTILSELILILHSKLQDRRTRRFLRYVHTDKNKLSCRQINKIAKLLIVTEILPQYLSQPSTKNISVYLSNSGPRIVANINGQDFNALLDSGSSFTLLPYEFWTKLGINEEKLDKSQKYNISSATHVCHDSVLGRVWLNLKVKNVDGSEQLIPQLFLVLNENMKLQIVLLGSDFLSFNRVNLKYSRNALNPKVLINGQNILIEENKPNVQALFIDSFLASAVSGPNHLPDTHNHLPDTHNHLPDTHTHNPQYTPHALTPDTAYDIVALSADFDEATAPSQRQLSRLSDDTIPYTELMLFAQENSTIKDQHFSNRIQANSAITGTEGQRIIEQLDKNDIIPEPAPPQPTANLQHLSQDLRTQYEQLIRDYNGLYATSKS